MLSHEEQIVLYHKYEKTNLLKELEIDYQKLLNDIFRYKKEDLNKDFFYRFKRVEDPVFRKFILQVIVSKFEYLLFKTEDLKGKINNVWNKHFNFEVLSVEAGNEHLFEPESDYEAFKFLAEMKSNLKLNEYMDLELVPYPKRVDGGSFLGKFELDFQSVVNSFFLSKSFAIGNEDLMKAVEERAINYFKKNCVNNIKDFISKTVTSNNNNAGTFIRFLLSNKKISGDIEIISAIECYLSELLSENNNINIFNFELKLNDIILGLIENNLYTEETIFNLIFSSYFESFEKKPNENKVFTVEFRQKLTAFYAYREMQNLFNKETLKDFSVGDIKNLHKSQSVKDDINKALNETPFHCEKRYISTSNVIYEFKLKDGLNMKDLSCKEMNIMNEIKNYFFWKNIDLGKVEEELSSIIAKREMIEDIKNNISNLNNKKVIKKF